MSLWPAVDQGQRSAVEAPPVVATAGQAAAELPPLVRVALVRVDARLDRRFAAAAAAVAVAGWLGPPTGQGRR